MIRRRVLISGRVQGVSFRDAARTRARRLGVTGRVLNRDDGRVQLEVQGSEDAVARMIDWAGSGPPAASVSDVEVEERAVEPDETRFDVVFR